MNWTEFQKTDIHVHTSLIKQAATPSLRNPKSNYICEPEELMETLIHQGITQAVLMSSGESFDSNLQPMGANNEECLSICQKYPYFFKWMCNFNPATPETLESRMAAYKTAGAVGVGEVMVNQWMDSPFLTTLFSSAEKLKLPVLCHLSPEPGFHYGVCDYGGLPLLEKTLQKFPHLNFIGHSQVFWLEISGDCPQSGNNARNNFGRGPVKQGGTVERLMETYPNLYGDLSAYSGSCAILRDETYGLAFLERFQDRLLFGTDTINQYTIFPLCAYLDKCATDGRLSWTAYEKICFKNASKLFGI